MMSMNHCYGCRKYFSCNVSMAPNHKGEPICADCFAVVNYRRACANLPLWSVPPDAYEPEDGTWLLAFQRILQTHPTMHPDSRGAFV